MLEISYCGTAAARVEKSHKVSGLTLYEATDPTRLSHALKVKPMSVLE